MHMHISGLEAAGLFTMCSFMKVYMLTSVFLFLILQTNRAARCGEWETSRCNDYIARETTERMWCVAYPVILYFPLLFVFSSDSSITS